MPKSLLEKHTENLFLAGDMKGVLALLEKEISLNPKLQYALGLAQLHQERWKEGWKNCEARLLIPELQKTLNIFPYGTPFEIANLPKWEGQKKGELLLSCEQGFGDCIQFIGSYFNFLNKKSTTILCHPLLEELFRHSLPEFKIITVHHFNQFNYNFDFYTSTMSLPYLFHTRSPEPITPWLKIPPQKKDQWNAFLKNSLHPKIGLVWKGNPTHTKDHLRSTSLIAFIEQLEVVHLPQAQWISFQVETTPEEDQLLMQKKILPLAKAFRDFADSAEALRQIDLLISVDTAMVHLAGSLGVNTLLLNAATGEWRWGEKEGPSLWYQTVYRFFSTEKSSLKFPHLFANLNSIF